MHGLEKILLEAGELLSHPAAQRLGWTLLHFLWQGTALALALGVALLLLPRGKPNVRYAAACLTLLMMAIAPVGTFFAISPSSEPESSEPESAELGEITRSLAEPDFGRDVEGVAVAMEPAPADVALLPPSDGVFPSAGEGAGDVAVDVADEAALAVPKKILVEETADASPAAWIDRAARWMGRRVDPLLPWLVAGWLAGVLILSTRLLGGWTQLHRLRRRATWSATARCQALLEDLARRMHVNQPVRLMESALVRVPAVVGFLRPLILLPASAVTSLSSRQLEAILAHELAHIRRHDYLVNLLQTTLEALLFYHPGLWWVSGRMRIERENCCDDLAALACGDAVAYALALADLEEMRADVSSLAMAASGGSLLARIRRLVGAPSARSGATSRWLAGLVVLLGLWGGGFGVYFGQRMGAAVEPRPALPADERKSVDEPVVHGGKTIAEWMAEWDTRHMGKMEKASAALLEIGQPAVPALLEELRKGESRSYEAREILRKMGPEAEEAVPYLIETAMGRNADSKAHKFARWNGIYVLGGMRWASERAIPVFKEIAEDTDESELHRSVAVSMLEQMGKETMPILKGIADSETGEIRDNARAAIFRLLKEEGPEAAKEYYTKLIEAAPFDPSVPDYLNKTKTGCVNNGWRGLSHPLSEEIKALYRERLSEKPDPELAWRLAEIIEVGMGGTSLQWSAPSDSASAHWSREDPAESYVTMVPVLEHGFRHADKDSELWREFGVRLARLRLLQGDWEKMSAVLEELGEKPVSPKARPFLPGPPKEWEEGFSARWVPADEAMISGKCAVEFRFEKDGKGLQGVHVLLKKAPEPESGFRSGIRADTLFFGASTTGIGYGGADRALTRYAVSDASGVVRFDKLPKIPVKIEVLVPTGNFPEHERNWSLWMEVEPEKYKPASNLRPLDGVDCNSAPAVVELVEGEIVRYPRMVVLPEYALSIRDWDKVDLETFELSWNGPNVAKNKGLRYEIEMSLSAPGESTDMGHSAPVVQSARQITTDTRWPVGEKGVGGMRLASGNFYLFAVRAIDGSGAPAARWSETKVWVPWGYRRTEPPIVSDDHVDLPPVYSDVWHNGNINYGKVEEEDFRQRIDRFLRENPDSFEADYNRVGKAWIEWDKGDPKEARKQFEQLIGQLPKGNLARGTAIDLLARLDKGEEPPRNLQFVADTSLD